jgi:hypothetical protein
MGERPFYARKSILVGVVTVRCASPPRRSPLENPANRGPGVVAGEADDSARVIGAVRMTGD